MKKWIKVNSIRDLIPGQKIAFTINVDNKITELWNNGFTLLSIIPNSQGEIEITLSITQKDDIDTPDILSVKLHEINDIYVYNA